MQKNNNNGVENKNKNNDTINNDGGEKKEDGSIAGHLMRLNLSGCMWLSKIEGEVINSINRLCDGVVSTMMNTWVTWTECFYALMNRLEHFLKAGRPIDPQKLIKRFEKLKWSIMVIVPPKKKNGGNDGNRGNNDGNDGNDGNGGVGGDEKKKKEDKGNGGGKMNYPAGQSRSGQRSYGKVSRHPRPSQAGVLECRSCGLVCSPRSNLLPLLKLYIREENCSILALRKYFCSSILLRLS
ncbi:uncharacterized protein MAL13P1.304-like isoform X2 [Prunus avium]|uniref:Uncharacterized protein MAL13P1.304-like isoform X2 n=1 Tax=Prunus avium TaxID=42229 RepID=A0A6P5TXI0_PRUAV|nr:uncharacterized protein MAL13P1.304-like isoform X2 [Prunus avium]